MRLNGPISWTGFGWKIIGIGSGIKLVHDENCLGFRLRNVTRKRIIFDVSSSEWVRKREMLNTKKKTSFVVCFYDAYRVSKKSPHIRANNLFINDKRIPSPGQRLATDRRPVHEIQNRTAARTKRIVHYKYVYTRLFPSVFYSSVCLRSFKPDRLLLSVNTPTLLLHRLRS